MQCNAIRAAGRQVAVRSTSGHSWLSVRSAAPLACRVPSCAQLQAQLISCAPVAVRSCVQQGRSSRPGVSRLVATGVTHTTTRCSLTNPDQTIVVVYQCMWGELHLHGCTADNWAWMYRVRTPCPAGLHGPSFPIPIYPLRRLI
jgi:hypothetical protein